MFAEGKSLSINTSLLLIDLHQKVTLTYPIYIFDDSGPSLWAPTGSEMFGSKLLITRKFATSLFFNVSGSSNNAAEKTSG